MKLKFLLLSVYLIICNLLLAQYPEIQTPLDKKVSNFLEENATNWKDMNVSLSDGKILYDLIVQNKYKSAVEIGTSTGHSAIWMAWALSKTGGKLITIEIDKQRYLQAKANFKKAGVSKFVDARLGDAHKLVPELPDNYDFVFCDADKYWYKNYFVAMSPKLVVNGCFTAHNTAMRTRGIREFLDYIETLQNYRSEVDRTSRSGISKSFKLQE